MGLHNPPHPGRSIRRDCLEALGLTVTDGAKILGITRHMLSRILNGQAGVSPEMAVRLEKAFGGTAESWLALQQAYDLGQVERGKIKCARRLLFWRRQEYKPQRKRGRSKYD